MADREVRTEGEIYPGAHGGHKDGEPRERAEMPEDVRTYANENGVTIHDAYVAVRGAAPISGAFAQEGSGKSRR